MSSPSSVSSATLPFIAPFIADETQTQKTSGDGNPDRNSSIAAGKSKLFSFKAFKIGAVLLLLVFPLLQNLRALLFLHHHQLQNDDRYKEELMDLPVQQSRSTDAVDNICDKGYLEMNPDVAIAVKEGKLQSGFQHWNENGERQGRTPYCLPSIERPFVFFHNRKCGGTTLRAAILTAARRHNMTDNTLWIPCYAPVNCEKFDDIPRESYRAIYASHINYEDVVRARRRVNSTKLAMKKDFLGQMVLSSGRNATYYHLNNHHQHFSCLTNIRDTVSRVVSCYNYRFLQNGNRMTSWEMPNITEMTADDWTVLLPQAYDKYSGGCNNEMLRTFGSLNDETMINTLTRNSPFFESELHRAKGRMAQCIIVDLDRCKDSNAVLRYYLPWLGNGLDLCSERENVGLRDRDSHIQKGSAEAILTLNEFDEAMFQFGTQLFEHQLQNTMV